jgi:hypothetical protein
MLKFYFCLNLNTRVNYDYSKSLTNLNSSVVKRIRQT